MTMTKKENITEEQTDKRYVVEFLSVFTLVSYDGNNFKYRSFKKGDTFEANSVQLETLKHQRAIIKVNGL